MAHESFESYVREAEAAERMALRATTDAERQTWSDIALLWRDLAQRKLARSSRSFARPRLAYEAEPPPREPRDAGGPELRLV